MEKDMNFDTPIDRKNSNCVKHDDLLGKFGKDDILPLWVADMDFAIATPIVEAIEQRLKHPVFGYSFYGDEYFEAIGSWYEKRYLLSIAKEEITPLANVASAIAVALEVFSDEGDEIMVQTPIYPAFIDSIARHKRTISTNTLRLIEGRYEINWEDFELKAKSAKIFLLCSPHNPTGRAWREWEIEKMSEICDTNGVLIISDEIHSDLTHENHKHTPACLLDNQNIIMLNSPAKRFNVPSIANAYAVTKNQKLKETFEVGLARYAPHGSSPIAQAVLIAAYTQSQAWLEDVDKYLALNLEYVMSELTDVGIKAIAPESSFLLWLDCREISSNSDELASIFVNKLKLGLNNGAEFGNGGDGFMRLNYAVSKDMLMKVIKKLKTIDN